MTNTTLSTKLSVLKLYTSVIAGKENWENKNYKCFTIQFLASNALLHNVTEFMKIKVPLIIIFLK